MSGKGSTAREDSLGTRLPYVRATRVQVWLHGSLVPRPSSRAVDPLPEKIKREEGLVKLITVTGRKEVAKSVHLHYTQGG